MLHEILIYTDMLIFVVLSLLHFYWVFGGKWGLDSAMPPEYKNDFFDPKNKFRMILATGAVAVGLLCFALVTASNLEEVSYVRYSIILTKVVAIIFIIRAIGDFKNFGLFRKPAISSFAKNDRRFYVPLCIFLGASLILISTKLLL